jgi:hypothetical protein
LEQVMTAGEPGAGRGAADGPEESPLPAGAVRLRPGDRVMVRLPSSEVVMHLRLDGALMMVELTATGGAQIRKPDGSPVSFPVLPGEAGIYTCEDGTFYTYPEAAARRGSGSPGRTARARALPAAQAARPRRPA